MKILLKITRYGLSKPPKAAGWDPYGDSGTDKWEGNRGNTLSISSCALTASAARALEAKHGDLIRVQGCDVVDGNYTPNPKFIRFVTYDDTAPEEDMRLDLFYPFRDYPEIPEHGMAEIVELPLGLALRA